MLNYFSADVDWHEVAYANLQYVFDISRNPLSLGAREKFQSIRLCFSQHLQKGKQFMSWVLVLVAFQKLNPKNICAKYILEVFLDWLAKYPYAGRSGVVMIVTQYSTNKCSLLLASADIFIYLVCLCDRKILPINCLYILFQITSYITRIVQ